MLLTKLPFNDTRAFTPFFLDYIQQKETLTPFYSRFPSIENFNAQLHDKSTFPAEHRNVLVNVLQEQYKNLSIPDEVKSNITSLRDSKTFTITTGHQLNIFTGPLYFIYKIVTVINACKQLKAAYPQYNFVPVYWMASEDHDYDEIKYFRLYGKKYTWETDQKGAVGRFTLQGMDTLLREVPGEITLFREAYHNNQKLSDAVRDYVNRLFGNEGLVVVDADHRSLKSLFKKVIHEDVVENTTKKLVDQTNTKLEKLGYKAQIFCRDINFFYLDDGIRNRIEKSENHFKVVDSDIHYTQAELNSLIEGEPEKFSPNVILRPLYQEIILPNLGYVGGPAEVIYWLQLKSVFDHYTIPFPILIPRNFAIVVEHTTQRKLEKTGLELKDFFEEKNYLFNHWIVKHAPQNLTVGDERTLVLEIFEKLKSRTEAIDSTLSPFVAAEGKRALNSLEKIERKMLRAAKRLHSDKLRQIEMVKDILFPNGSLQERTDNFLNFYQQDQHFIHTMLELLEPFDFQFNILTYPSA
ncbi:MAG: bacillithiol biosynthesis cysteine-adding enzyme BshC [Cyclobacteriaceae bacterium]|nr:bacillithiol biosynthesis cysteine-adding enzyme BshC [Cyclobacteriaceae bacterium]